MEHFATYLQVRGCAAILNKRYLALGRLDPNLLLKSLEVGKVKRKLKYLDVIKNFECSCMFLM